MVEERRSCSTAAAAAVAVVVVAVAASSVAGRQMVPAMYVFGDSLVDVGNNDFLPPPAPRPPEPPCGIDLPPEAAAADGGGRGGRFTNGFNLADVIAQHVGFKTSPPAYLSLTTPERRGDLRRGLVGANYASSGSGVLDFIERRTGRNLGIGVRHNGLWYLDRSKTREEIYFALSANEDDAKVYLMKHKSEVLECFKTFYAYVKNQFGTSVQIIRSDNGTKYVNKEFQSLLFKEEILHQTSCPDTSPQNGVAERKNRHLLEGNGTISLGEQVKLFAETKVAMVTAGEVDGVSIDKLLSRSLFITCTGGNDYNAFTDGIVPVSDAPAFIAHMVAAYIKHIKTLYNLGARRLGILDVLPLGCLPISRITMENGSCSGADNWQARLFNHLLRRDLAAATASMPDLVYSIGSIYYTFYDMIENPSSAGLKEVAMACCGDGKLNAEADCSATTNLCPDRDDYIFWDKVHGTQAAYQHCVHGFFHGSPRYAEPISFTQLVASPAVHLERPSPRTNRTARI